MSAAGDEELDPREEAERARRRDREATAEQRDLMRPGMGKVFKQIQDAQAKAAREPTKPSAAAPPLAAAPEPPDSLERRVLGTTPRSSVRRASWTWPTPIAAHAARPSAIAVGSSAMCRVSGSEPPTVSPTIISSVAGSRPSASHAARSSASSAANFSSGRPYQAVCQASARRAVIRIIRGRRAATRIGVRWAGGGRTIASSSVYQRPAYVTEPSRSSRTMTSRASSKRPTRWSNG